MIPRLSEMMEKATKGPLELGRLVKCDCGDGSPNCWHTFDEQVEIFPVGDESGPIAVASSEDRAALIVALHNCAKELLRVAEAAKGVVKLWQDPRCNHVPDGAIELLETALHALEKVEGKP